MFETIEASIKPLTLNSKILDAAYELYLQAPQDSYPVIDLHTLSQQTGKSLLSCRNEIVEANKIGRFPNCALKS